MQLIIISGRSGSGKSTALHVLEDIGFTCIDNLPASLLTTLAEQNQKLDNIRYAVSIDARNHNEDLKQLPAIILHPSIQALDHQIIFLDASDDTLLKRFSETRRRHPLSDSETNLLQAIHEEQILLKPLLPIVDTTVDTSDMNFHDLREHIKRLFCDNDDNAIIMFQSFGYKYGLPKEADVVFDVRCLPNPYWKPELRSRTGKDDSVRSFLDQQAAVTDMYQDIQHFLSQWLPRYQESNRSYITIAIGCTGGQHRSVYLCERLSDYFDKVLGNIQRRHRELPQYD